MQQNTIYHIKDLFQFVVYVIDAIFGKDIRNTLLTMDEEGIQQIVPFANQAMIEARSEAQSQLVKAPWADPNSFSCSKEYRDKIIEYWSDPKNREAQSELMKVLWADPNHVFNSKEFCDKMIECRSDSKKHEAQSEAMTEYWANNQERWAKRGRLIAKKKDSYPKSMGKIQAITQIKHISVLSVRHNIKVKILIIYSIGRIVIILLLF